MRGFSRYEEPFWKKLRLPEKDTVELVSECVDLTLIIDSEDDTHLPKKVREKKAKKAEKRRKEEQKRAEAKAAAKAKKKAQLEARLKREALEEARQKADAAARRHARRTAGYDQSAMPETDTAEDIERATLFPIDASFKSMLMLGVTIKPPQSKALVSETKPEIVSVTQADETDALRDGGQKEQSSSEQDVLPALDYEAPGMPQLSVTERTSYKPEDETPIDEADSTTQQNESKREEQPMAMADAIAAAQQEESVETPLFESFEAFNAKSSHYKAHGMEAENDLEDDDDDDDDEDDEDVDDPDQEDVLPMEHYSLQDLPEDPTPASSISSDPGFHVAHFIRFAIGAWQRALGSGKTIEGPGLTAHSSAMFQSVAKLKETIEALKPLLKQLRFRKVNEEALTSLHQVVQFAAGRDYVRANQLYVGMTMGKKTWHNSIVCFQQQQNHGGSVRKILKQSELVDFDWDPVMQAYMHALKRLIQFVQCVRPPDNPSGIA
mmetsp:Transcript_12513/g.24385  ORF Transcript_12513/g.24385 Transcript_12513/m.24385 type:complete len:494 (-) Transcript_12513:37-1518(-)